MSLSIAFLITAAQSHNDNHLRLPRLFSEAGWQVTAVAHDDLNLCEQRVFLGNQPAHEFDMIWPIGLGPRRTFLDRQQLLNLVPQEKLITRANAYLTLHGKTAWLHHAAPTAVANHAAPLIELFTKHAGQWVLKPVAGSFGVDVSLVASAADIERRINSTSPRYWMLQRFIPEIYNGETRTLICAGAVIGSYLRTPGEDLRANLATHGVASKTQLSTATRGLVNQIREELLAHQVGFAAIDTVGGYLMEVNIANPGGLQTCAELYDGETAMTVGKKLLDAVQTHIVSAQSRHRGPG